MAVVAVMRDGREVQLAARYGSSLSEFFARVNEGALVGSAAPLAEDVELETAAGGRIRYVDANAFSVRATE